MAAASLDEHEEDNAQDERMNIRMDDFRMVFQCISGKTLMLWRSMEDFEAGSRGGRRAPRPLTWLDLRRAFDVHLEAGDPSAYLFPNRITVMTTSGNFYFCAEHRDDACAWLDSVLRCIQDYAWQSVCQRDSEVKQRKRWIAACGVAEALFVRQAQLGERAMAILFHQYNLDMDCKISVGELMLLLQELVAAVSVVGGAAEALDRNAAIMSSRSFVSEEELFDRAMRLRRRCCPRGDGIVTKDEFVLAGGAALAEVLRA